MNEKEIKNSSKKSLVKAPHDFTDRLMYRIENEATANKPLQISVSYIVMGAIAFIAIIALITIYLPESSITRSSFSVNLFKRAFQILMAIFFLVSLKGFISLLKNGLQVKKRYKIS